MEFLGRPIQDDEMPAMYTYRVPEPAITQAEWEEELDLLINMFPQSPVHEQASRVVTLHGVSGKKAHDARLVAG